MSIDISDKYDVAVLVPCYNEEQTIGDVVKPLPRRRIPACG
jgi:hypothetical protein